MTLPLSYDPSLQPALDESIVTSYFSVVSFAVVTYDWVLTFGQEIDLIWRQRWSTMAVLYLTVRYIGMPFLLLNVLRTFPTFPVNDVGCTIFGFTGRWMSAIANAMLGVIMITRLHAMYQQSRKMLICLILVYLSIMIACVILITMDRSDFEEEVIISGTFHICASLVDSPPVLIASTWIMGAVWEILALCLAIWIAVKHLKELQRSATGCLRVLVKTHIFYFAAFAVASCFNLGEVSGKLFNSFSTGANIYYGGLILATAIQMFILGPRLILGVREQHARITTDADPGTEMNLVVFRGRVHVTTESVV